MTEAQEHFIAIAKWTLTFHATTPDHVRDWWRRNLMEMQRIGIVTLDENNRPIPSPLSDEIIGFCKTLTAKLERGAA